MSTANRFGLEGLLAMVGCSRTVNRSLVGIPYVENRLDLKRRARRRLFAASMVSLWIGAIFLMVVTPL